MRTTRDALAEIAKARSYNPTPIREGQALEMLAQGCERHNVKGASRRILESLVRKNVREYQGPPNAGALADNLREMAAALDFAASLMEAHK